MTDTPSLTIDVLPSEYAVCRLPVDAQVPNWAWAGELVSITSSDDELSLVCEAVAVPEEIEAVAGWKALKVRGPLDFELVGVLANLSTALAEAGVSIFAISTYETDYILVREERLEVARDALRAGGHRIGRA
jgi:hypothetical protein